MKWLKHDPLLAWLVGAMVMTTAAEGFWLWRIRGEAIRATSALEQINRERDGWRSQSVAPIDENERAVAQDLVVARAKLAEIETTLAETKERTADALIKPTDAYFEIASFVEKARALAAQSHVAIRSEERFGFGSYASEGPAGELVARVLRQRRAIEVLLETVMAAQPATLMSVQREQLAVATQRSAVGDPADFFEPSRTASLRKSGWLEADAFKLEFAGPTQVLRDFLSRLLSAHPAFAVRSVEEEPVSAIVSNSTANVKTANAVPIIAESHSRFRVVVERLHPVVETEKGAR